MYLIVVYDIEKNEVNKIHKYLKKRLNWIQNSVFEWELSESEYVLMMWELKKMIKTFKINDINRNDSIIVFNMPFKGVMEKTIIWYEKSPIDNFI